MSRKKLDPFYKQARQLLTSVEGLDALRQLRRVALSGHTLGVKRYALAVLASQQRHTTTTNRQ